MRNEENQEASFDEREELVGRASQEAAVSVRPTGHEAASPKPAPVKRAHSTLAIVSYVLSAAAVVAAWTGVRTDRHRRVRRDWR